MNKTILKIIQQNFVRELQAANAGKKTSLPFIVHKLSSVPIIRDGEVFQVMVIGGSIFKKALCKKTKEKISIVKKETEKSLVSKTENEFLRFIESEISKEIKVLALNFAYPLKPVFEKGRLDGVLLAVTKEGGFHGLVGKRIGEEIERYIWEKRKKKIMVSVANDTICLLMSGLSRSYFKTLTSFPRKRESRFPVKLGMTGWEGFEMSSKFKKEELAAGIVGTGFNIAFFLDKEKAVNLESANFDKFPQSKEGKLIDSESAKHGRSLFEKEIAGAYLYKHFNLIIKEKRIDYPQISSTEELNALCHPAPHPRPLPRGERERVRVVVSEIAQNLLRRSAKLVACQIAGIVEFKKHDIVFNMEGSLFWKGNNYRETVEQTVKELVPEHKARFVEIKDSAILGAAELVA